MKIIPINDDTLNAGHATFQAYLNAALCGPGIGAAYDAAMRRTGGIEAIPGAVNALIEQGVTDREAIVCAAARVSRCRRSTVRRLLDALAGDDAATHLWAEHGDRLAFHEGPFGADVPRFLLAA